MKVVRDFIYEIYFNDIDTFNELAAEIDEFRQLVLDGNCKSSEIVPKRDDYDRLIGFKVTINRLETDEEEVERIAEETRRRNKAILDAKADRERRYNAYLQLKREFESSNA